MHRILPNILFIVIIFILATAFPLSTDILSLDLSQQIVDQPVDEVVITPKISTVLPELQDSILTQELYFDIKSTTSVFPADLLSTYSLDVFSSTKKVKSIPLSDLTAVKVSDIDHQKRISISKSTLLEGLDEGYYTFKLVEDNKTQDYSWYASNVNYSKVLLKTTNQVSNGNLGLILYYPTSDYQNLVPISRIIKTPDNRWRTLYTTLLNGPKTGLGLYEGTPSIPYAPNIKISKGVATIYMYSANIAGFEDKFPMVVKGISKTFMTLGPLDGVNFLLDDSSNKTVSGVDLKTTFTTGQEKSAYVGYTKDSNYMMLMPLPLSTSTFDDQVNEIIKILKGHTELASNVFSVLPDEITLQGYTLSGSNLQLNFSANIDKVLSAYPEYELLMYKALIYSCTSLEGVSTVQIQANGVNVSNSLIDFNAPVSADKYLNLEP
ncbi:GerMN domain-containing protein [Fusibacter bizertensis]